MAGGRGRVSMLFGLLVAVGVAAALGLSGDADEDVRACTLIGCDQGVRIVLRNRLDVSTPWPRNVATVTACSPSRCRTVKRRPDAPDLRLPLSAGEERDGHPLRVRIEARDRDGESVSRGAATLRISEQEPNGPGCGTCFNASAVFQLRSGDVERPTQAPGVVRRAKLAARSYANQRYYREPRRAADTFGDCNALRTRTGLRLECAVASYQHERQLNMTFGATGRGRLRLIEARDLEEPRPLPLRCGSVELPRHVGCG